MKRSLLSSLLPVACATSAIVSLAPTQACASEEHDAPPRWPGPRSQFVWIDAQAGVESVQMETFNANFQTLTVGLLPTAGVGPTANVGAGIRLVFVTLGLRGHLSTFGDDSLLPTVGAWQIWSLDGEIGLRIPLGRFEPHVAIAGGYTSFGGFDAALAGLSAGLDVHGLDARIGAGLDWWLWHAISLGINADAGLLAVARPGISARDLAMPKQIGTLDQAKVRVLEASGSSVGTMVSLTGDLGVHF